MSEVLEKYPTLCFTLRAFEDEITAKLAVQECSKHELLNPYPVLLSPNSIVAQFALTVAVLGGSTIAIAGLNLDESTCKTEKTLKDEQLKQLLSVCVKISVSYRWTRQLRRRERTKNNSEFEHKVLLVKYKCNQKQRKFITKLSPINLNWFLIPRK